MSSGRPFFLELAPVGPHEACTQGESGQWCGDPLPAPRHAGLFPGAAIPSTRSWLTPFPDPALTGKLQPPQRASNGSVIGPYLPPSGACVFVWVGGWVGGCVCIHVCVCAG